MSLLLRRLLCLACFAFLPGTGLAQTTFTTVVVFGDSLSDTGNIAHLVSNATGGLITYPADNPTLQIDYTEGRFTDGKDTQPPAQSYFGVWVEQLAGSFPAKPAVMDSLDGGTNFAYGDATTGSGTTTLSEGPVSITLHNMGQQVTDYLSTSPAPTPNASTLYVLWGGANDVYEAVSAASSGGGNTTTAATTAATTAVANEVSYIQELVQAGATNFMLPNLPPLGGVPNYATTANATALDTGAAAFQAALTQAIATLKATYATQGVTVNFYQPDIFDLFASVAAGPTSLGFSNVTAAAQNISASPDTYLIWDGLHPTTTGHHYAAQVAANLLTPLVASTVALTAPAAAVAGQTVTLTATASGTGSTATPTGMMAFFNGTTLLGSGPVTGGSASVTVTVPAASATPYSVTAVYAGDTTFNHAQSAAQSLTSLGTAVATTTTLISSQPNAGTGQSVTLTATVTPAVTTYGQPAGTVTFYNGITSLGTGTLSNGQATLTTTALPNGTLSLTAVYGGAGLFAGSTSAALTETVATPGFTAALNPTSLTIKAGSSGTTQLSTTDAGGFSAALTPSCGTLPAHMTCAFAVDTAPVPTGEMLWTLTVATNGATAALELPRRPGEWRGGEVFSAALLFSGTLLLGLRRRLRSGGSLWLTGLVLMLAAAGAAGLAGCGGGNNNTPTGTYTVPVIVTPAAGSSVGAQTVNLSVTVQ